MQSTKRARFYPSPYYPVAVVRSLVTTSGILVLGEGFRSYESVIKSLYDQNFRIIDISSVGDIMVTHLQRDQIN